MKKSILVSSVFVPLFLFCFAGLASAEIAFNYTIPFSYQISSSASGNAPGSPSGMMAHLRLDSGFGGGLTQVTKGFRFDRTDDSEQIKVTLDFYDLLYEMDTKYINLQFGLGFGTAAAECVITSICTTYGVDNSADSSGRLAMQYFTRIGVPFTSFLDIHLLFSYVSGEFIWKGSSSTTDDFTYNYSGFIVGSGLSLFF